MLIGYLVDVWGHTTNKRTSYLGVGVDSQAMHAGCYSAPFSFAIFACFGVTSQCGSGICRNAPITQSSILVAYHKCRSSSFSWQPMPITISYGCMCISIPETICVESTVWVWETIRADVGFVHNYTMCKEPWRCERHYQAWSQRNAYCILNHLRTKCRPQSMDQTFYNGINTTIYWVRNIRKFGLTENRVPRHFMFNQHFLYLP